MFKKKLILQLRNWLSFLALFLTVQDCSEPFEFDIVAEESVLVVDGFITNQLKEHLIRLSYTSSVIDNFTILNPVRSAQVSIIDDQGVRLRLSSNRNGDYFTPVFAAEEGRSYQLTVELGGRTYQSPFVSLPAVSSPPRFDVVLDAQDFREVISGTSLIRRRGASISAAINKNTIEDRQSVHYQWFVSDCRERIPRPDGRFCDIYDNRRKPQLYLHRDKYIDGLENVQYNQELTWIPKPLNSDFDDAMIVEIDQFVISQDAYEFWSIISNAIESTGTIFDPVGSRYIGNIEDTSSGNHTLGFFGVYWEANDYERIIIPGF